MGGAYFFRQKALLFEVGPFIEHGYDCHSIMGRAVHKRAKSVPLSSADRKVAVLGYAEEPPRREFLPTLKDIARAFFWQP